MNLVARFISFGRNLSGIILIIQKIKENTSEPSAKRIQIILFSRKVVHLYYKLNRTIKFDTGDKIIRWAWVYYSPE
jgi:hypothetical protein